MPKRMLSLLIIVFLAILAGRALADVPSLPVVTEASVRQAVFGPDGILALARGIRTRHGTPGIAIGVVFNGTVIALEGLGVRRVGMGGRVTADTVFPLASVSKPIASTVLAKFLTDDGGKWDWDTAISEIDPEFRLRGAFETSDVTIKDLFSHRSGLPEHAGDLMEDLGFSRSTIMARLKYHSTVKRSFRARYAYTNFGLSEPAFAVAKFRKPGMDWETQAATDFFSKIGMDSTSYKFSDLRKRPNRAFGHMRDPKTKAFSVTPNQRQPDAQSPAGGCSSSVRDLSRFMLLHLGMGVLDGKRIISEAALGPAREPQMRTDPVAKDPNEPVSTYGMGWRITTMKGNSLVSISHSGAFNLGAATSMIMVPKLKVGIVVLTNAAPEGYAEAITFTFIDKVVYGMPLADYEAVMPPVFAEMLKPLYGSGQNFSAPAPNPWKGDYSPFIGIYGNNPLYGTAEVAWVAGTGKTNSGTGSLILKLGPENKRQIFALKPWDGLTFYYQPIGENAGGPALVTFTKQDGRAVKVVIENLERGLDVEFVPVGEGTFTR